MPKTYEMRPLGTTGTIFVAVPRERMYIPGFVDNLNVILARLRESGRYGGSFAVEGHRVDFNRDILVDEFLKGRAHPEWLLMLDSDMLHPEDIPFRLTSWGKPIVGGLYFYRGKSHDPFFFQKVTDTTDKWGRTVPRWKPIRKPVYDYLKANDVPLRDEALVINDGVGEALIECDAVATGTILIHRSVLETMEPPWFEYRDGGISEDLQFCWEAKTKYGIPVYGDMSTISGHFAWQAMGYTQFMKLHEQQGLFFSRFADEPSPKQLAKFYNESEEKLDHRIKGGSAHIVGDYWKERFGNRKPSDKEIRAFYREEHTGKLYIIELLHWNASKSYYEIQKGFLPIRNQNIYEIGAGIGTLALQMAVQENKVVAVEANKHLRDLIQWRVKRTEEQSLDTYDVTVQENLYDEPNSMDYAIAIDVVEHLLWDELVLVVMNIHSVLKMGGHFWFHNNFEMQDLYPMHFNYSDRWGQLLKDNGFLQISPNEAIKVA